MFDDKTFITLLPYVNAWGSTQVSLFTPRHMQPWNDHERPVSPDMRDLMKLTDSIQHID